MNCAALELRDIRKRFGKAEILRGVSLAVEPGQCLALIGPNGAGKSTLFDAICGRTRPDAGRVLLFGVEITNRRPLEVQRLGIARGFQRANVFARLSAFDNLRCAALAARGHRLTFWRNLENLDDVADRAAAVLARIGLSARRDVPAAQLTYAEQRALDLGIALAGDARLLLLDEPTAGMSPEEAAAIVALIRREKGERTILIVEHDLDAVFGLADRIAVMADGRILADGAPDDVRADPRGLDAYVGVERPA